MRVENITSLLSSYMYKGGGYPEVFPPCTDW